MLKECRIVAETFVEYCKKVAKEGVEATVSLPLDYLANAAIWCRNLVLIFSCVVE